MLKREKLHSFHYQRVQCLLPRDYPARVAFCETMLRKMTADPEFFDKILWSDESTCKKDGYFNMHNLHSWQLTNPHLVREDRSQYQFKINLWTGILNGNIIGPFELPGTLTADSYLNFSRHDLPTLLENVSLEERRRMWLQHDGCPAHYARCVRDYLDEMYPRRWIGRLGTILWPPRSSDLNPLDFSYWGCLKEKVYKDPITSVDQLRERVQMAAQKITELRHASRIKRSFIRRCRACIRARGGHFEHLL